MDELSTRYGFYLTFGAIEDDTTTLEDGEALYHPHTMGSSRDTKLLFDTTQVPWLKKSRTSVASWYLQSRCRMLLYCRLELLISVMRLSKNPLIPFTLSPQAWLQYQLSCQSERDSFLRLFRLSIFTEFNAKHLDEDIKHLDKDAIPGNELLWCFDEVQRSLSELSPRGKYSPFSSYESVTILDGFIFVLKGIYFRIHQDQKSKTSTTNQVGLLSGTALNIDRVRATLEKSNECWFSPTSQDLMPPFPLQAFSSF
jgi:hypothetical protein